MCLRDTRGIVEKNWGGKVGNRYNMHCRKQLQLSNSIDPINRRAVIVGCNSIMFRIYCCNLSKLRDLEINNISSPDEESSRVVAIKQKKLSDTFNRVSTIFAQCIFDLYLLVIKWIEDKSDAYAYAAIPTKTKNERCENNYFWYLGS